MYRMYFLKKNDSKLNSKETTDMITRWTRDLNRPFIKKDTQMANKYMRRCSTSLAIRERQTETMMRYHCASIRMAGIKNTDKPTKTGADQNVLSPELLAIGVKTRWHRTALPGGMRNYWVKGH